MAISEEIQIVQLTTADVEAGLALSDEAGWNQTGEDWRVFIEAGNTIGARDIDGRLIATAAALPYNCQIGYVGMVLVTRKWRRKGLATRLVDLCIAEIRDNGLVPMLDATQEGELVYSRQGFRTLFKLDRWQANLPFNRNNARPGRQADFSDLAMIIKLDEMAFGSARPALIESFMTRAGTQTFLGPDDSSFAMIRDGRRARQAGPIVARSETCALKLLESIIGNTTGAVFIDVPSVWNKIGEWLRTNGFSIQRSFSRMALGASQTFGRPERLFAVAGPEFG